MYSNGILVMFVVLLVKCLKWLTNARTPYALVHMMASHTAFDYELVTQGSGCPSAMFTFVDFAALFFREAKCPPPPPAPLLPSSAVSKLELPTCLYCTDIRIII